MKKKTFYIIDFDSTFVTVEALDLLARIALKDHPRQDKITKEIENITRLGMEGKIGFRESLTRRLTLFQPNNDHITKLISELHKQITPSITRNIDFFIKNAKQVYIISGGFKEYIYPVIEMFGLDVKNVLANEFRFDKNGTVVGFDTKNPLSQDEGKVKAVRKIGLKGRVVVIGDGITDYQIKERGVADVFYYFAENVRRGGVMAKADAVLPNFDEFLFRENLPRAVSYPKHRMKVLLLENIDQIAVEAFKKEGYVVEVEKRALGEEELAKRIEDISILGIRSKTEVTPGVLKNAKKLLAIGAFCIGTNQVDLQGSSKKGIAVFNAPYSNTRSVVELVIGEIIILFRQVFDRSSKLHDGVWDKSSAGSFEVRGKKLGIIGYGNIGTQLGVLAENLGMKVYFFDIADKLALGNAKKCNTLSELLRISDAVTVHVDGRKTNKSLISTPEFEAMKQGVIFLNNSRGSVVDVKALERAIKNGRVKGAAVDVFPQEPKSNKDPFISDLQRLPNVILTPHIGGSTEEAQRNIGEFVSQKLIGFINRGNTMLSVNFPQLQLPELRNAHRLIHIHENKPGLLAGINQVLAQHEINIAGQYLQTNSDIGYVITDIDKKYDEEVIQELKEIEGTIRLRVLY